MAQGLLHWALFALLASAALAHDSARVTEHAASDAAHAVTEAPDTAHPETHGEPHVAVLEATDKGFVEVSFWMLLTFLTLQMILFYLLNMNKFIRKQAWMLVATVVSFFIACVWFIYSELCLKYVASLTAGGTTTEEHH